MYLRAVFVCRIRVYDYVVVNTLNYHISIHILFHIYIYSLLNSCGYWTLNKYYYYYYYYYYYLVFINCILCIYVLKRYSIKCYFYSINNYSA